MTLRLRISGNGPAVAEIDDGSGWRLVPPITVVGAAEGEQTKP